MPSPPDLLRMLFELYDAAWGVSEFATAFKAASGYFQLGLAARSLSALWLIACTGAFSVRATRWLLPNAGLPLRWGSIFCVGMWLSTVGFAALRELQAFKLGWALLACSALLACAVRVRPDQAPLAFCLRREWRALRALRFRIQRSRYCVFWAVFAGFAVVLGVRMLVIPPLGWDTLTYHGPRAAQWVQTGKFTFDDGVGSYNIYRHFFSGNEVLMAWAMLPFHSDLFANLATFVQWIGVGLSGWALSRALGLREPFASTSACAVMFMPTLQLELGSGYVEISLNAALMNGIAAALTCLRAPQLGSALVSALSLGVAAGIKLPGVPPGVVVASVLAARLLATGTFHVREKLATLSSGLVLASLPALPWIGRAWLDTGYPLSPMPAKLFGVTLGVASHAMEWYGQRPNMKPYEWEAEKAALLTVFSPLERLNETLGAMTLLALLVFPVGLVYLTRRRPLAALALSVAALMPVLAHYGEQTAPLRLLRSASSSRFLVPVFALILPVSLAWCRRGQPLATAYRWLILAYPLTYTVLCVRRGWADWEHRELVVVALALSFLAGGTLYLVNRRRHAAAAAVLALGFMWFCSGLQLRRDETRSFAYTRSYALHNFPRFWADGLMAVDDPENPRKIAITGGPDHSSDKWFHYFYLGRRLQNRIRYVVPTRDGKTAHFGLNGDLEQRADKSAWLGRLDKTGSQEVVTFPPRSIELGWMEETPERFEKLAGNKDWGLFRIRR